MQVELKIYSCDRCSQSFTYDDKCFVGSITGEAFSDPTKPMDHICPECFDPSELMCPDDVADGYGVVDHD